MRLTAFSTSLLALILSLSLGKMFVSHDDMLSPENILWPNSWVPNIVDLSSNHAGDVVNVTITCNILMLIPAGSYVSATFYNFPAPTYSLITQTDQPETLDNQFIFTGVQLPSSAGTYGPVSLRIRFFSSKGLILGDHSNLATLSIVPKLTALGTMQVLYPNNLMSMGAGTSLEFVFTLSKPMNIHDYIAINIDTNFDFSNVHSLSWKDGVDGSPYFNTTAMAYEPLNKRVVIYGLSSAVNSGIQLDFQLSGIVNPSYVVDVYTWSVDVFRFGTSTKLQRFSGSGPRFVYSGNITVTQWAASNNYVTKFVPGIITYMNLSFVLPDPLPMNGVIDVSFSNELSIKSISYQSQEKQKITPVDADHQPYMYNLPLGLICSIVDSYSVSCKAQKLIQQNAVVTMFNLVQFSGVLSASIMNITTKNSDGRFIDVMLNKYTITYADKNSYKTISKEPWIYFSNSKNLDINYQETSMLDIITSAESGIVISTYMDSTLIGTLTLMMPFLISSNFDTFKICFETYPHGYSSSSDDELGEINTIEDSIQDLTKPYSIIMKVDQVKEIGHYTTLFFPSKMYLPLFQSSLQSQHEFFLSYTSGTVTYMYSKPFFIRASTATMSFKMFCKAVEEPGLPGTLEFKPSFSWAISTDYTAFIEFTIISNDISLKGDFGSGLESGSIYPSITTPINELKLMYTASDSLAHTMRLVYTYGVLQTISSTVKIIFPLPELGSGDTLKISARLVANRTSDAVLFTLMSTNQILYSQSNPLTTDLVLNIASDFIPAETIQTIQLSLSFTKEISGKNSIFISLSQGNSFTAGSTITFLPSGNKCDLKIITSSDPKYMYNIGYCSEILIDSNTLQTWNITQMNSSWIINPGSLSIVLAGTQEFTDSACTFNSQLDTFTLTSPSLTLVSYSPTSSKSAGADFLYQNYSIVLTLPRKVPSSNIFSFTFSVSSLFTFLPISSWTLSVGSFKDSGALTTQTVTSQIFNNSLSVGDTLKINLIKVMPGRITIPNTEDAAFTSIALKASGLTVMSWNTGVISTIISKTTYSVFTDSIASGITTVSIFPNVQGAEAVYLQIIFKPLYTIPAGSKITVSGINFNQDAVVETNLWFSGAFKDSSVSIVNKNYTLSFITGYDVLGNTTAEIRKDLAYNIPTDPTSPPFLLTITYNGITIINDIDKVKTSAQSIIYNISPTDSLILPSLSIQFRNKGEESIHLFGFKLATDTDSSWMYCFDVPIEYIGYGGNTHSFNELPDISFLTASSTISEGISCMVDHFLITCIDMGVIPANTIIDISLLLINPSSNGSFWNIYIVDSNYKLMFTPEYTIIVNFTDSAKDNVDLLNVIHDAAAKTQHSIELYTNINEFIYQFGIVYVRFPDIYNLEVNNPSVVLCKAVYLSSPPIEFVPTGSLCQVSTNYVKFTVSINVNLTISYNTVLTLYDIQDPGAGYTRTTGYDALDATVFLVYDYWTTKFRVYTVSQTSSGASLVTSSSFFNRNAAYTGYFSTVYEKIIINSNKNVYLVPGTFTEQISIGVNNNKLKALSIKLLAIDQNDQILEFDNFGSYTITEEFPIGSFSVGAPITTPNGYYYITWIVKEIPMLKSQLLYITSFKTLVEVSNLYIVPVNIGAFQPVPVGLNSFPIPVDLGGVMPYNNLTISFTNFTDSCNFSPNPLTFSRLTPRLFFEIRCRNLSTPIGAHNVNYTLSGSESSAFSIDGWGTFIVVNINRTNCTVSTEINIKGKTKADLIVTINQTAVVTWALMSTLYYKSDPSHSSYNNLLYSAYPVIGTPSGQFTLEEQLTYYKLELLRLSSGNWSEQSLSYLEISFDTLFVAQTILQPGSTVVYSFNNLVANSSYTAVVFANSYTLTPSTATDTKWTYGVGYPTLINIKFDQDLNSQKTLVNAALAYGLKVNALRVVPYYLNSRRLNSELVFLFMQNILFNVNTSEEVEILDGDEIRSNILQMGGMDSVINDIKVEELSVSDFGETLYYRYYWNISATSLVLNITTAVNGTIYCLTEKNPNLNVPLTAEQLLFGYNRMNVDSSKDITVLVSIPATFTFYVVSLNTLDEGNFTFTCTVCNNFPIIPYCLNGTNMIVYNYEHLNKTSSGLMKSVSFILLLSYLINL